MVVIFRVYQNKDHPLKKSESGGHRNVINTYNFVHRLLDIPTLTPKVFFDNAQGILAKTGA